MEPGLLVPPSEADEFADGFDLTEEDLAELESQASRLNAVHLTPVQHYTPPRITAPDASLQPDNDDFGDVELDDATCAQIELSATRVMTGRPLSKVQTPRNYFTGILPPEIRVEIYTYLFTTPMRLRLKVPGRRLDPATLFTYAGAPNLSILLVSRLTNSEALPILYDSNTIVAEEVVTNPNVKESTAGFPLRADFITYLEISTTLHSVERWFDAGDFLPRLKTLAVDYRDNSLPVALSWLRERPREYTVTCTGICEYLVQHKRRRTEIRVKDHLVIAAWEYFSHLTLSESRDWFLTQRPLQKAGMSVQVLDRIQLIFYRLERSHIHRGILLQRVVPFDFYVIWPLHVPIDLRRIDSISAENPVFQETFSDTLLAVLARPGNMPMAHFVPP